MRILKCRRSIIALVSLGLLFILGLANKADVGGHIVAVVLSVCGANASQAIFEKRS